MIKFCLTCLILTVSPFLLFPFFRTAEIIARTLRRQDVGDKYATGVTKVEKIEGGRTSHKVRTLKTAENLLTRNEKVHVPLQHTGAL